MIYWFAGYYFIGLLLTAFSLGAHWDQKPPRVLMHIALFAPTFWLPVLAWELWQKYR